MILFLLQKVNNSEKCRDFINIINPITDDELVVANGSDIQRFNVVQFAALEDAYHATKCNLTAQLTESRATYEGMIRYFRI